MCVSVYNYGYSDSRSAVFGSNGMYNKVFFQAQNWKSNGEKKKKKQGEKR